MIRQDDITKLLEGQTAFMASRYSASMDRLIAYMTCWCNKIIEIFDWQR